MNCFTSATVSIETKPFKFCLYGKFSSAKLADWVFREGLFSYVLKIGGLKALNFLFKRMALMFLHCENTVELRRNELRRDWKNQKMCSLVRFHTFYYYCAQNYRLLDRDLHQIGVRYIWWGCTVIDYAVPYSH